MAPPPEPAENSQKFFIFFHHEVTALHQQMDLLADKPAAGGARADATSRCQAGISSLSSEVKAAAVYLPAYDQRTYGAALKALQTRLEETRAAFAPKAKFAFKSVRRDRSAASLVDEEKTVRPHESAHPSRGEASVSGPSEASAAPSTDTHTPPAGSTIAISNQTGARITLPQTSSTTRTTGTLSRLDRCIIDLSARTASAPLAGLTLKDVSRSLVVCGRVDGAAHLTNVRHCTVVVSCRQFRMHESAECSVYLRVGSRPVVEDVRGVRFAPLEGEGGGNQWDGVQDFKWLRAERSPNWSVLPEGERVGEGVWRDVVRCVDGDGVEGGLAAVGL